VKSYLRKLRGLQNHLGDLNDVANVRSVVAGLLREKNRKKMTLLCAMAAGAMVGWYGAQVPGAVKQALKRYRKVQTDRALLAVRSDVELHDHRHMIAGFLPAAHLLDDLVRLERALQAGARPDMIQTAAAIGLFPIGGRDNSTSCRFSPAAE
jgi:hypothetical protein